MATPHGTQEHARQAGARESSRPPKAVAKGTPAQALPVWAKVRADGCALVLTLHVQPGARLSGPAGRHGEALKLRIAAPASDNKANEALASFLQRNLGVPREAVRIAHGRSSRHKVVEIAAVPAALAAQLDAWDRGVER